MNNSSSDLNQPCNQFSRRIAVEDDASVVTDKRIFASPLARRIAKEARLGLMTVKGSGLGGRIQQRDVVAAIGRNKPKNIELRSTAKVAAAMVHGVTPIGWDQSEAVERFLNPKAVIPHFYLKSECRVDRIVSLCPEVKSDSQSGNLSVLDFVVAAVAAAMRVVPTMNASFTGASLVMHKSVDVGIAIFTDSSNKRAVVRSVETKSLRMISNEIADLIHRGNNGALDLEECLGGNITVSCSGAYGIDEWVAVISPPQSSNLAIGAIVDRATVQSGQIVVAKMLTCVLSADHRAIDGATGAEFLRALKSRLENPALLLL